VAGTGRKIVVRLSLFSQARPCHSASPPNRFQFLNLGFQELDGTFYQLLNIANQLFVFFGLFQKNQELFWLVFIIKFFTFNKTISFLKSFRKLF